MNSYIYTGLPEKIQLMSRLKRTVSDYDIILDTVCNTFNISRQDLVSQSRLRILAEGRAISIGLILQVNPHFGLKKLGAIFNRHHSTIINSHNLYKDLYKSDKAFTRKVIKVLKYV